MVFGEARGEPFEGRVAVAHVALERFYRGGWYGSSLHEVLLRDADRDGVPEQFSCFRPRAMGGQLEIVSAPLDHEPEEVWVACFQVAAGCRFGWLKSTVGGATHYVATTITAPEWTKKLTALGELGRHRFWRAPVEPFRPTVPA